VQRLERDGVIAGYHARIDPKKRTASLIHSSAVDNRALPLTAEPTGR
jgi:DNA-binding Lrp family transcriptional regulator